MISAPDFKKMTRLTVMEAICRSVLVVGAVYNLASFPGEPDGVDVCGYSHLHFFNILLVNITLIIIASGFLPVVFALFWIVYYFSLIMWMVFVPKCLPWPYFLLQGTNEALVNAFKLDSPADFMGLVLFILFMDWVVISVASSGLAAIQTIRIMDKNSPSGNNQAENRPKNKTTPPPKYVERV